MNSNQKKNITRLIYHIKKSYVIAKSNDLLKMRINIELINKENDADINLSNYTYNYNFDAYLRI